MGWIKLHRELLDSQIFASEKGLKIWIWILLKANHKQKFVPVKIGKGESIVNIERGQFLFGRFSAEEDLNINGSTIYKWIKKMEQLEMIELNSNSHYTVLTVCKYNAYNDIENEKVTATKQPIDSQQTAMEHKQEGKEGKESKEKTFNAKSFLLECLVENQIAVDFLKNRKLKRLANTETAFKQIINEINKTELTANDCIRIAVENGWGGFKANWITNNKNNGTHQKSTSTGATLAEIAAIAEKELGHLPDS